MYKVTLFLLIISLNGFSSSAVLRGGTTLIDEIIIIFARNSDKALTQSTKTQLKKELLQISAKYGDKALIALKKSGKPLINTAQQYGDVVWRLVSKYPKSSRSLVSNPTLYLKLSQKYGDDILKIEAKSLSSAPRILKEFGEKNLPAFANKIPAKDYSKLTGLAARADSPATKQLLLERYLKGGRQFLNNLNTKKILTVGLSSSMIIASYKVSDGIQEATKTVAKINPKEAKNFVRETLGFITTPIKYFLFLLAIIVLAPYAVKSFRKSSKNLKENNDS